MTDASEITRMPRDANGNPIGSAEKARRIIPPVGVPKKEWEYLLELAAMVFKMTAGVAKYDLDMLRKFDSDKVITEKSWKLLALHHNEEILRGALAVRGVLPLGSGLTTLQSLLIDSLTNPADQSALRTKLRKLGISQYLYNEWTHHKAFQEQLRLRAERNLNTAAPLVTMNITRMAAHESNLAAIVYFDKRAGRDPDRRENIDSAELLSIVVEVLTKQLVDQPELLRRIAAELEVRTKLNGNANPAIGSQ
jgi:hypothetical protein